MPAHGRIAMDVRGTRVTGSKIWWVLYLSNFVATCSSYLAVVVERDHKSLPVTMNLNGRRGLSFSTRTSHQPLIMCFRFVHNTFPNDKIRIQWWIGVCIRSFMYSMRYCFFTIRAYIIYSDILQNMYKKSSHFSEVICLYGHIRLVRRFSTIYPGEVFPDGSVAPVQWPCTSSCCSSSAACSKLTGISYPRSCTQWVRNCCLSTYANVLFLRKHLSCLFLFIRPPFQSFFWYDIELI